MQTVWNDSGCKECRNAKIVDNSLSNCRRIGHQKQVSSIYQSEQPEVEYQAVQSQLLIKKSEYHALSSSQPFIRLAPLVTFVLSSPPLAFHTLSRRNWEAPASSLPLLAKLRLMERNGVVFA